MAKSDWRASVFCSDCPFWTATFKSSSAEFSFKAVARKAAASGCCWALAGNRKKEDVVTFWKIKKIVLPSSYPVTDVHCLKKLHHFLYLKRPNFLLLSISSWNLSLQQQIFGFERAAGNCSIILWDFPDDKDLRTFFCINWNIAWHLWRHTFIRSLRLFLFPSLMTSTRKKSAKIWTWFMTIN